MIDTEHFTLFRSQGLVVFTMKHDIHERETIEALAESLKSYLRKSVRQNGDSVPLLVDLRQCVDFTGSHVMTTTSILLAEQAAVMECLCGSAVLLRSSPLVNLLRRSFETLYKPVRPFSISDDETEARKFLQETKDKTNRPTI